MTDGTVAGKFELNGGQPITTLSTLRREGERTSMTMRDLGRTLDSVGGATSARGIQTYRTELRGLQDDARGAGGTVSSEFRSMERTVLDSSAKQVTAIRELRNEIDGLGRDRARASVDVSGIDTAMAKVVALNAELDRLNRKRATPRVGAPRDPLSGGGGSPGGGGGSKEPWSPSSAALTNEFTAIRSWERGHPTFWGGGGSTMIPSGGYGPSRGGGGGGSMLGSLASDFDAAGSAAGKNSHELSVFGLGVKELAIGAAAALPAIQALGGAAVALGGSFAMAAEGLGAVGVAGGSSLLVGLGSIVAVAKPAVTSITEVWKAGIQLEQAQMQTPQHTLEQMQNTDQLTSAQNALTQSQFQARSAQVALTEARRDARRELENLNLTTREGTLNEQQAQIQLKQARLSLAEAEIRTPGATPQEEISLATSHLSVQQATLGVERSRQTERVNREKQAIAQRRGISGAPQVLEAENAARQARLQIALAQRQITEANLTPVGAIGQAEEGMRKALQRAPAGTRALVQDALLFRKEWHGATRSASGDFVAFLNDAERTGKQMLPLLSQTSNASMRALRVQGGQFLKFMASDTTRAWITSSEQMFTSNLENMRLTGQNVATTLMHISEAAAPFLRETISGIEHMTHGWATSTEDIGAFRARLRPLYEDTKAWWHLMDSATHLLGDLFRAGAPSGTSMVEHFTLTMDHWDEWIRQNPAKVQAFFHGTVESTEKLLSALGSIVKTLNEGATLLKPLLNDLSDLVKLTSALGVTGQPGLFLGLTGAYQGLKGRAGGGGAGGAAAGGVAGLFMGRGGGGGAGGGAASATIAARSGGRASFLAPVVPFSRSVATPEAFAQVYGGLPGAHYAAPMSSVARDASIVERGANVLKSGASKLAAGARGFAEAAAPMVLLTSALQASAGQNPTQSKSLLGSLLSGGVTGGAAGLMLPGGPFTTAAGAIIGAGAGAFAHEQEKTFTGGKFQHRAQSLLTTAQKLASEGKYQAASATLNRVYAGAQTYTTDEGKLINPMMSAGQEVVGQGLGSQFQQAFGVRVHGGMKPKAAMAVTVREVLAEQAKLGPEGARQLDKVMVAWAAQQGRSNPKLLRQVSALSSGIEGYFKESMESIRVINGQIYTNTSAAWQNIAESLTSPIERATESVTHGFTTIQEEAIHGLTQMGFSRGEAADIVKGVARGGKTAQLAGQVASRQASGKGGEPIQTFQQAALNKTVEKKHASGGRLAGVGNADTVRMGDGGLGAPGELVLNHHTEADVDRDLLLHGKPPLGWRVATEHRMHSSAPAQSQPPTIQYGIMPGRATGGRLGALNMGKLLAEANRISNLDSTYVFGGGHVTPAPANPPWDCSSSWSRLLQSAGENIPTMVSGDFESWGLPGPGAVTLYANPSHVYGSINGRFWGTSLSRPHGGAGWFQGSARPGFVVRHAPEVSGAAGAARSGPGVTLGPGGELVFGGARTNLGGAPGAMVLTAGNAYGHALTSRINAAIGSTAGGAGAGGAPGPGMRVGASFFGGPGDPGSTGSTASGAINGPGLVGWAELSKSPGALDFSALGHLPMGTRARISYGGKSIVAPKVDVGAGGGPVNGYPRDVDLTYGLARQLPGFLSSGLGVVGFQKLATGGRLPKQFAGWFQRGGSFTTDRPTLFGAGDGQATGMGEHVTVRPARKSSAHANSAGQRPIVVSMNFGNVTVGHASDFKKVVHDAADEAAHRLLKALEDGRGDEGGMW